MYTAISEIASKLRTESKWGPLGPCHQLCYQQCRLLLKITAGDFWERARKEEQSSLTGEINRSPKTNLQTIYRRQQRYSASCRSDALTYDSTSISLFDLSLLRIISCPPKTCVCARKTRIKARDNTHKRISCHISPSDGLFHLYAQLFDTCSKIYGREPTFSLWASTSPKNFIWVIIKYLHVWDCRWPPIFKKSTEVSVTLKTWRAHSIWICLHVLCCGYNWHGNACKWICSKLLTK